VQKPSVSASGLGYGLAAYFLWGSFPIIIQFAKFATAFEIVVWRVVFGFLFAAALVTITGTWKQIWSLAKSPKKLGWIAVAAFFIFINWEVYVYGVVSENVIEASLGYFINPLVTVMFAVVILKEKLRPRQWLALGVGLIAVIVWPKTRLEKTSERCRASRLSRQWCCRLRSFSWPLLPVLGRS